MSGEAVEGGLVAGTSVDPDAIRERLADKLPAVTRGHGREPHFDRERLQFTRRESVHFRDNRRVSFGLHRVHDCDQGTVQTE